MKLIKFDLIKISVIVLMILLSACSHESVNQEPRLQIINSADGLNVSLKGSADDPDGIINEIVI